MAQMKNKINERNTHSMYSVICGHDKSAPTMGVRGINVGVREQPQRTFRRRRDRFIAPVHIELYKCNHASQWVYVDKHWLYTVIRSVYSVIFGHDKSAPTVGVRE